MSFYRDIHLGRFAAAALRHLSAPRTAKPGRPAACLELSVADRASERYSSGTLSRVSVTINVDHA